MVIFTKKRGFTLIELLIVVAIIAILAAIAVPNFLEAQARSKVSRVKADMRTVSTAIEAYAVDWNTYPPDGNGVPYVGLIALTTPVAFITSMFPDIFNHGHVDGRTGKKSDADPNVDFLFELGTGNISHSARNFPAQAWAIASYGPDKDDDTHTIGAYPYTNSACPYDPTNGTLSNGDVYRLGPFDTHPNYETDENPLVF